MIQFSERVQMQKHNREETFTLTQCKAFLAQAKHDLSIIHEIETSNNEAQAKNPLTIRKEYTRKSVVNTPLDMMPFDAIKEWDRAIDLCTAGKRVAIVWNRIVKTQTGSALFRVARSYRRMLITNILGATSFHSQIMDGRFSHHNYQGSPLEKGRVSAVCFKEDDNVILLSEDGVRVELKMTGQFKEFVLNMVAKWTEETEHWRLREGIRVMVMPITFVPIDPEWLVAKVEKHLPNSRLTP